jgi:hypothetical protein
MDSLPSNLFAFVACNVVDHYTGLGMDMEFRCVDLMQFQPDGTPLVSSEYLHRRI